MSNLKSNMVGEWYPCHAYNITVPNLYDSNQILQID